MSILETIIMRYRSTKKEDPLYQCKSCNATAKALTKHIVCPECGGKLERIDLSNK